MAIAAGAGLVGIILVIVLKSLHPHSKALPSGMVVFLILLSGTFFVGFGAIFVGMLRADTALYTDRLEIHNLLWPWSKATYRLDTLAGVGLYLRQYQASKYGMAWRWEFTVWYDGSRFDIDDNIRSRQYLPDKKVEAQFAHHEDPIRETLAGQVVVATREQALRCQGPGGPMSAQVGLAKSVVDDMGPTTARWTPDAGLEVRLASGAWAKPT